MKKFWAEQHIALRPEAIEALSQSGSKMKQSKRSRETRTMALSSSRVFSDENGQEIGLETFLGHHRNSLAGNIVASALS
jgi:hypothetical protein